MDNCDLSILVIENNIFTEDECKDIFKYLNEEVEIEYRKEYKGMYGRKCEVPRGQASFTLHPWIHYDYKVSGGSPPNYVMNGRLVEITERVNKSLGTNFNTILMNLYKDGEDCISYHQDKETGWREKTGFATLSFGAERDFAIKRIDTGDAKNILHKNGMCIHMPYPLNHFYYHAIPKRKKIKDTRISLTFREIITEK